MVLTELKRVLDREEKTRMLKTGLNLALKKGPVNVIGRHMVEMWSERVEIREVWCQFYKKITYTFTHIYLYQYMIQYMCVTI